MSIRSEQEENTITLWRYNDMSGSVNKVILVGNLGRDPQVNYTKSGKAVASFSIATSERWKDKDVQA